MKFEKTFLQNLLYGEIKEDEAKVIEDNITSKRRWSDVHKLVFQIKDKYYKSIYTCGATENQEEAPYDNAEEDIECQEVVPVEKKVIIYEELK